MKMGTSNLLICMRQARKKEKEKKVKGINPVLRWHFCNHITLFIIMCDPEQRQPRLVVIKGT